MQPQKTTYDLRDPLLDTLESMATSWDSPAPTRSPRGSETSPHLYGVIVSPSPTAADTEPVWLRPVLRSIDTIQALPTDWDSYGASPIPRSVIEDALGVLHRFTDEDTPPPALVPTSSGSVQIEWHQAGVDIEVYVREDESVTYWFRDRSANQEREGDLVSDPAGFVTALRRVTASRSL